MNLIAVIDVADHLCPIVITKESEDKGQEPTTMGSGPLKQGIVARLKYALATIDWTSLLDILSWVR